MIWSVQRSEKLTLLFVSIIFSFKQLFLFSFFNTFYSNTTVVSRVMVRFKFKLNFATSTMYLLTDFICSWQVVVYVEIIGIFSLIAVIVWW